MKLAMTYSYLKPDLQLIEQALEDTIQAKHPILNEASTQLLKAGGKRLRPIFVLLAGQFGDYNISKLKAVAVSLELIHMASLVHDDVIDDSKLRRGKPTVKAKWNNQTAMYTGDYIFARSLEYLAHLDNPRAHQILAKTMIDLTVGEIEQIKDKYNFDQHLRHYLRRIKRKTALLISSSCQLGAIASNASLEYEKKLKQYGYNIGMSYQIIDDILDFTGSSKQLGKPAGSDLIQGNITLPTLIAMQDESFYNQLMEVFSHDTIEKAQIDPLITYIKKSDAIEKSYHISNQYLNKATEVIESLPNIKAKQTFEEITNYIGKRKI
ncbi:heptaprenyl diphosphate synthase component II [Paraliobacillus salinarum]|uniref:heptaprenyl diphosphate synthase component II n=1 Tax=Paraliobacillus salinarum TaxID=1158996 RepID=UPI0015F6FBCD|nr:heptaprenyl diphosphate synthase component II [Paraliobacillus salinarum]